MKLPLVYGVTHDADTGELTARVPRAIKVAIGKPKDSGLHVYIAENSKAEKVFVLEIGRAQEPELRSFAIDKTGIGDLRKAYYKLLADPAVVKRRAPVKLPYFTFLKDAGDGTQVHDLETIAKYGSKPRELEIIMTEDGAFRAGMEFWDAKGLKCHGDGRNAQRSVNFVATAYDVEAAKVAVAHGRKWFPIVDGCATRGCEFALLKKDAKGRDVKQCSLHGSLAFQLVNSIRLGAKAEFNTTGGKSVRQLLACLTELASFTGGGNPERGSVRGIPLVMVVGMFKTNYKNQPGTAYAVRLEFREDSVAGMQEKILEAGRMFGAVIAGAPATALPANGLPQLGQPAAKQLAAPAKPADIISAESKPAAQAIEGTADEDAPFDPEFSERDANDEAEAGFIARQFGGEDDDVDDDGTEPDPQAGETFDEAKAELMMQAEAANAAANDRLDDVHRVLHGTAPTEPATTGGGNLFTESELGGDRYKNADPGEQEQPGQHGRRGVRFGGKK